jgi:hypothetical protein
MKCKKCGKEHDGSFGSGVFCSRSCANSREQSATSNLSRSKKLKTSVDKFCQTCKKKLKKRNQTGYCSKHYHDSELYKKILSCALKGKTGGVRHGGGHSKSGWYKGIRCDSRWELAFVVYCLDNGISIKRNYDKFDYLYCGELHGYYPDFVVNDDTYVEVKGYWTEQFNYKIYHFPNNLTLEVFDKNKIAPILKWIKEKYGKKFEYLYEYVK